MVPMYVPGTERSVQSSFTRCYRAVRDYSSVAYLTNIHPLTFVNNLVPVIPTTLMAVIAVCRVSKFYMYILLPDRYSCHRPRQLKPGSETFHIFQILGSSHCLSCKHFKEASLLKLGQLPRKVIACISP